MEIRRMTGRKVCNPAIRRIWSCVMGCMLAVWGCAAPEPEEDNLVIMEQETQKSQYILTEAVLGDVVLTEQVPCTYRQGAEEEVAFSVSGRQIDGIYVRVGDNVTKGQLLAELADNNAGARIEELEYKIERNRVLLEYVDVCENQDISAKWLQFIYHSGRTETEEDALMESIEKLQQENTFLREDYEDAIYLDRMELEQLREEDAAGRLYAGMDGTVSWIRQDLEGSTCARDEAVMRIIDSTQGMFVVEDITAAGLFQEGVMVEMTIPWGTGAGQYGLLPYQMDAWGEELVFSLAEEYDGNMIEVGTDGVISVELQRKDNVLLLPLQAVHRAEDRFYVYVVGEGGMREVKWVETGLHGDNSVEIREGLEQGEKVVLK